jgi:hypothetical protein
MEFIVLHVAADRPDLVSSVLKNVCPKEVQTKRSPNLALGIGLEGLYRGRESGVQRVVMSGAAYL